MLKVITAPTVEPISVAEAKLQSVIGVTADDGLLAIMISAAREAGESLTRRSFAPKTLELVLDAFPLGEIELPESPITAITSVTYIDEDGAEQTMPSDEYDVDIESLVGRISPLDGELWPDTKVIKNAVRIRYTAGWTASNIPPAIKQWLMVTVAGLYMQRENFVIGQSVTAMNRGFCDSLLDKYRVTEAP